MNNIQGKIWKHQSARLKRILSIVNILLVYSCVALVLSIVISVTAIVRADEPMVGRLEVLPYKPQHIVERYFDSFGMRYNGGNYENELIQFRLHIPYSESLKDDMLIPEERQLKEDEVKGQKYPLMIWFHGRGEVGRDNVKQLRNLDLLLPYLHKDSKRKFFLLVPQCPPNEPYWVSSSTFKPDPKELPDQRNVEDSPVYVTRKIVDELLAEFPIDKKRIYVMGFSDGCNAVSEFLKYDDLPMAGAVFLSGNPSVGTPATDAMTAILWGKNDPVVDVPRITKYAKEVQDRHKITYGDRKDSTFIHRIDQGLGSGHDSHKAALGKLDMIDWMFEMSASKKPRSNP